MNILFLIHLERLYFARGRFIVRILLTVHEVIACVRPSVCMFHLNNFPMDVREIVYWGDLTCRLLKVV
jgi:hypothetical protein